VDKWSRNVVDIFTTHDYLLVWTLILSHKVEAVLRSVIMDTDWDYTILS